LEEGHCTADFDTFGQAESEEDVVSAETEKSVAIVSQPQIYAKGGHTWGAV
jgi:hypothetical protein